ncbi:retrovirus-related pol polyprotein from transposon TNT 1-94 [Tanacetum coccineum]
MWELFLTSNVFVRIGSKGNVSIIVGYMLHCIQSNTPFNFGYFMAKRMVEMRKNDRLIPYARLLTRVFKVAKEEHPHPNHFVTCKSVDPIFSTFNASTLEQTDIKYAVPEHGASSSHGPQLNPEERIESQINEWLDEDTWIGAEGEISSDEVIEKDVMDKLSFEEKMTYTSYLTSKR